MLVIPELKKVVIMPPRSGSTALKAAVLDKYPLATCPHRHGEAVMFSRRMAQSHLELTAQEYSFVYCLRDPVERLKSLWRYMQNVSRTRNPTAPAWWIRVQNRDADRPFSDWVMHSTSAFSSPDNEQDTYHAVAFQMPAAHKSATQYLKGIGNRPLQVLRCYNETDLTNILHIETVPHINQSTPSKWDDSVTDEALASIRMYHHFDYSLMELA
jgi:hypothetical protein